MPDRKVEAILTIVLVAYFDDDHAKEVQTKVPDGSEYTGSGFSFVEVGDVSKIYGGR